MSTPSGEPPVRTGAQAVVRNAVDPARRPDVLFRKRREEGHHVSVWWLIGAFVGITLVVIALMNFIPQGSV